MTEKEFLNGLAHAKSDVVQSLIDIFGHEKINYCVIGGLAVNAYADPVVSLDVDVVVAKTDLPKLKSAASGIMRVEEFPYSLNLYSPDADIRIQIQTDHRYQDFLTRAQLKKVLGYEMRVASVEDVLRGKIWAYSDHTRRESKRQKDLADILRIVETIPETRKLLPEEILKYCQRENAS